MKQVDNRINQGPKIMNWNTKHGAYNKEQHITKNIIATKKRTSNRNHTNTKNRITKKKERITFENIIWRTRNTRNIKTENR